MKLDKEERDVLIAASSNIKDISGLIIDVSQLAEKGNHLALEMLVSAIRTMQSSMDVLVKTANKMQG